MPSPTKLLKITQVIGLPETRHVLASSVRSGLLQQAASRAIHDRRALIRDVQAQATSVRALRDALGHPATRELAEAGLLFVPGRYMTIAWAATRAARRARTRRPGDARPMKNVTPKD
jgi:hypothetical protein